MSHVSGWATGPNAPIPATTGTVDIPFVMPKGGTVDQIDTGAHKVSVNGRLLSSAATAIAVAIGGMTGHILRVTNAEASAWPPNSNIVAECDFVPDFNDPPEALAPKDWMELLVKTGSGEVPTNVGYFVEKATDVSTLTIASVITRISTGGYHTINDGGHANYKRVGAQPSHGMRLQDAGGGWWEFADEVCNIKAAGARGDATGVTGVGTNDRTAIQNALDCANARGGGVVHIPFGIFRRDDNVGSGFIMYSNVTLRGNGPGSYIFFDDDPAQARSGNDFMGTASATGLVNVKFENFRLGGTASQYETRNFYDDTKTKQGISGSNITGLTIRNMVIDNLCFMALPFSNCTNVICEGNTFYRIARDGARFTNSFNVLVRGNLFRQVGDDAVAIHTLDAEARPGAGITITDNIFIECQGVKVLGAKHLLVGNNKFWRCMRNPIVIDMAPATPEGNTAIFNIDVINNQVIDTWGTLGSNYAITIDPGAGRTNTGLATNVKPGVNTSPWPYFYTNALDTANTPIPGSQGVRVMGNTVMRTLTTDGITLYSQYGFGEFFDSTNTGNAIYDPAITSSTWNIHGINVHAPINNLLISGNMISGCAPGFNALSLYSNGSANTFDFTSTVIERNHIFDCPGIGIAVASVGSSSKQVVIRDNFLNLDPFFRATAHNADNTWSSSAAVVGISAGTTLDGFIISGNHFKNCGTVSDALTPDAVWGVNYAYADIFFASDSPSNKGIRAITATRNFVWIDIDGDPTSATYDKFQSLPLITNAAMPTSGTYIVGHFVRNHTPVIGTGKVVLGWVRLTTGSGHVADTDWAAVYCTIA